MRATNRHGWLSSFAVAFLLVIHATSNAAEQLSIEQTVSILKQERMAGRDNTFLMNVISGAGRAYLMANANLDLLRRPKLYCQPGKFSLDARNYADIAVKRYEQDRLIFNASPLAQQSPLDLLVMILLEGLQDTFPCKQ